MLAPDLKKLKSMSDEEVVSTYNRLSKSTQVGTNFFMEEIRYREASKLNTQIVSMTRWITVLTVVITIATIVNVIVFLNDSPTIPGFIE